MEEPDMKFFEYDHLSEDLQKVSKPFSKMAHHIKKVVPENEERAVALRKLLESKDAAVRAAL